MEIEYIYHTSEDEDREVENTIRRIERENTIGCLVSGFVMLCLLFVFLYLLPFFLILLGISIITIACIIVYKAYLEQHVLNFIQKHNLRR